MRCFLVGLGKIKILAKRGTPVVRDAIRLLRAHCLALDTGAVITRTPLRSTVHICRIDCHLRQCCHTTGASGTT